MNIEEIKMDHFENFEELIKTCKMWIRDDDIDAYYRFFEFNCMKTLLTAYEKEKEKNKELQELYTGALQDWCKEKEKNKEYKDMIISHKKQLKQSGIYGYDYDLEILEEE